MANEMPSSNEFTGLSRAVIQYSEYFTELMEKRKSGEFTDDDWSSIESLVDVDNWERQGVFLDPQAEKFGWTIYKSYIERYASGSSWEGTLRNITETPGRVILEMEERSTREGKTDIANTVTIYEFNESGKMRRLEVYVMPLA